MVNLRTRLEVELMAKSGRLLNSVINEMKASCVAGVTTGDLDRLADRLIRKGGARPGFLGYQDFPKSTCISVNDEVVHGIPGKRLIKGGDIVSLDLGLVLNGFWADMGCTVAVGRVSLEAERLIRVTEESFWVGIEKALPGGQLHDISAAIQGHVEAAGYSVVRQFVGHGIGLNMHDDPQVSNFGVSGHGPELMAGMNQAMEPMVHESNQGVESRPIRWCVMSAQWKMRR